ncbi:hypothetical protein BGZ76_001812 [Entomortierella beljakovae]|nr:hypothetical protein BGZ76_001812 [Entomortierella beljakovae]
MDLPNLGPIMVLGTLYNSKSEQYTGISVLSDVFPQEAILSSDQYSISTKYICNESYKEKFKASEINGHLKLSILAGILSLNSQSRYLMSEKQSSQVIKVSMLYSMSTNFDQIDILSNKISDNIGQYIAVDTLMTTDATHIVTGVLWGVRVLFSFKCNLKEGESREKVEAILSSSINSLAACTEPSDESIISTNDMSIHVRAFDDVIPSADIHHISLEEAVRIVQQIQESIQGMNQGNRGVLGYTLIPIEQVRRHFQMEHSIGFQSIDISLDLINRVETIFDVIVEGHIELTEISSEILECGQYITNTEAKGIHKTLRYFSREEHAFKKKLSNVVKDIRTDIEDTHSLVSKVDTLSELIEDFEDGPCSLPTVNKIIKGYKALEDRILFFKKCAEVGFEVIPSDINIANFLSVSQSIEAFVLRIPKCTDYRTIEHTREWRILRSLKEDSDPNSRFIIYSCSIMSNRTLSDESNKLMIVKYHGGLITDSNVYGSHSASVLRPTLKPHSTMPLTIEERASLSDSTLRMPCPLSHDSACSSGPLRWICFKCQEIVLYGYDGYVYCECGKTKLGDCTFRCNSVEHGHQYTDLHTLSIQSICKKILPGEDEINILLLGETGVGKSTFINAFVNYLRYDSLEDAEYNEMTTLIYSSFEIQGIEVVVGKPDKNEVFKRGESSTQLCKSYVFPLDDGMKIRLIDTPGIGDTRGIKQDRINLLEILDYISGFDKINGVCILLAPDNPRLTTAFRFCIEELLMHLHKSAKDNIIFTFTKARTTFYGPGGTMKPLGQFIEELERNNKEISIKLGRSTLFYFDNEAFKLYAALKQGLQFDDKTKEIFAGSWTKSVDESRRLVSQVIELKPHKTKETVTLDTARRSVLLLAEPMAKINENIAVELNSISLLKKMVQNHEITSKDLKDRLMTTYMDLDPIDLDKPRTVCTSDSCSSIHGNIVKYDKHCHVSCYLRNISLNAIRHAGLKGCTAMNREGRCMVCGCGWEKHMHVKIDYTEVKKSKVDTMVEEELKYTQSKADVTKKEIEMADVRIKSLESERDQIFDALKVFTGFLLQNSIVVQNSGILDYIDMSIANQERIAYTTKDYTIVKSLKDQRKEYVAQIEIFERAKRARDPSLNKIEPEQVMSARDALLGLKINGEALRSVLIWGQRNRTETSNRETRVSKVKVTSGWGWGWGISSVRNFFKF